MSRTTDRYTIVIDGDNQKLELAATKTVSSLQRVNKAANDANGGTNKLAQGVRNASTNVAAFQGPLGGISGRLSSLSTLLGSVNPGMVALGLSVTGVTIGLVSAVREYDAFNVRNKKTEALLKATGDASGLTADQLDRMAKSVALNTLASVEGIKDAQNVLLTFKSVSGPVFEQAIGLSQDMAAVMGTDAKSAALQLGKALESPTQGITALKRSGVSFSEAEKQMIKDMEDAGRVADAQRYVLETLSNQIGGAGAAEADGTVVGAIDTFNQRWQELKVNVGGSSGTADAAAGFFNTLATGIERVNQSFFPDDEARFNELIAERAKLSAELRDLGGGKRATFLSWVVGTDSEIKNVGSALYAVNNELREIQERRKQQLVAESEAQKASEEAAEKRNEEAQKSRDAAAQKELDKVYAKNALLIDAMDMQFADEEEKIELNLQKNLSRIEAWQISEAEIKKRGFENMEQLRESYRDLAYERYDLEFMTLEEKYTANHNKEVAEEQRTAAKKLKIQQDAANARLAMETSLTNNVLALGRTFAAKSKRAAYLVLAAETGIKARQAITSGYEAGMKAAAAAASFGPQAAAAANAEMVGMGYTNAALITANGVAQGVAGTGGGGSVSFSGGDSVGTTLSNNDSATPALALESAAERRGGERVENNHNYRIYAMDSESFAEFASRNKSAIADATESQLNEYGRSLVS